MKLDMRWRVLIILGSIALAVFLLWPSWQYYRLTDEQLADRDPNQIENLKSQALRLGLDLQGGAHLVLELDDSEVGDDVDTADLMDRALEIIRNRIDQYGVSEPVVQRAGEKRIIVELAGIDNMDAARDIVSRAAVLEFQMVRPGSEVRRLVDRLDRELAKLAGVATPVETGEAESADGLPEFAEDAAATADAATDAPDELAASVEEAESGDTEMGDAEAGDAVPSSATLAQYLHEDVASLSGRPLSSRITYTQQRGRVGLNEVSFVREDDYPRVSAYLTFLADSTRAIPNDVEFLWGSDVLTDGTGNRVRYLYMLNSRAELTGELLDDARAQPDVSSQGNFQVAFDLNRKGRRLFSRTTGENVGRLMAIVLDNRVKSAPEIESKIRAGSATITGAFTAAEANELAIVLRAGALPVPIVIEEQRAVGPSLGHDSVEMGRQAILYGFAAVLVFMVIYYRGAGMIAAVALLLNLVLMLAALVWMDAVLTLPGIAGFVLTVGMAVDANVLIFERIREELRAGQTFRNALTRGYDRAFRTILDANLTTLFAAAALAWFGTGPIRGFAVVLSTGIIVSMFTALFVSRGIFDLILRGGNVRQIPV
ncbi:MAG: protein translocase subunit SecD [Gemmatimonadota bacterium]|nr:MAG: protein translocase subunit SecD [Gemmatimonadota bacterium]